MASWPSVPPSLRIPSKEELRLAHARVHSEARRAQSAAEEERRRIARELHDEFGQALTGLKFDLAWFGMKLTQCACSTRHADLLNKVQSMSGSVDALWSPSGRQRRPCVLRCWTISDWSRRWNVSSATFQHRTGPQCTIEVAPASSSIALPAEMSAALFRIAQELLTNVMRHADASQVHMRLYQDDGQVTLEVTDNGKGITRKACPRRVPLGFVECRSEPPSWAVTFISWATRGRNHGLRLCAGVRRDSSHDWDTDGENSRHRRSRSGAPRRETDSGETFPHVEVGEADTGQKGIAAVQQEPWDLAIVDISLPDQSGLELLCELHSAPLNSV